MTFMKDQYAWIKTLSLRSPCFLALMHHFFPEILTFKHCHYDRRSLQIWVTKRTQSWGLNGAEIQRRVKMCCETAGKTFRVRTAFGNGTKHLIKCERRKMMATDVSDAIL